MKKINIAVMGCANIAQRSVMPAIQCLKEKFNLIAVASRTKENAEVFSKLFNVEGIAGYENILERSDIDAIYMPLPTGLHEEWISKALEKNKHVLAEKSFVMNFEGAKKLVDIAISKNLLIMENFMFRFHSQHKFVFSVLKNNELGEIRLFRSQFGFPPLKDDNFRYNRDLGGGALLDAGAYTIRASQWFLGNNQKVLSSTLYIKNGVDIFGNAILINENNIVSQLSFGFDNYYRCNYEIWGSKGNITAQRAFSPKPDENTIMLLEKDGKANQIKMDPDNHFVNILKEFYNSIQNNTLKNHYDDILNQSRLLTDIQENSIKVNL